MEKDTKGFWNLVVGPVEPGLYSYAFQIDKVQFADLRNHLLKPYRGAHESLLEVSGARPQVWQQQPVPHGKARPMLVVMPFVNPVSQSETKDLYEWRIRPSTDSRRNS